VLIIFLFLKFKTMGKMEESALGGARGAVGSLVFGKWKGKRTVRMKAIRTSKSFTEQQQIQREKFSIASRFINSMTGLLKITYADQAKNMSGNNAAFAKVIKNKITGVYPNLAIDYASVLIAAGSLVGVGQPATVSAGTNGILTFNWADNSGVGEGKPDDLIVLVAYSEELAATDFVIGPATREANTATMNASRLLGKEVHTWLTVISPDKVANSVYTGKVTVL
jgi:hypothetical protein